MPEHSMLCGSDQARLATDRSRRTSAPLRLDRGGQPGRRLVAAPRPPPSAPRPWPPWSRRIRPRCVLSWLHRRRRAGLGNRVFGPDRRGRRGGAPRARRPAAQRPRPEQQDQRHRLRRGRRISMWGRWSLVPIDPGGAPWWWALRTSEGARYGLRGRGNPPTSTTGTDVAHRRLPGAGSQPARPWLRERSGALRG